ncbi:MAG: hypothetical protein MUD00_02750 [Candidatus Pacebacteria bacterium]|nr:hypothetical protein [Candidatus Paceibacterota bacterium]
MQLAAHIHRDTLHHAYLIEGEHEVLLPSILTLLDSFGVAREGNPDVTSEYYELFTVDDARALRARQVERSAVGDRRFFLIGVRFFTREAENALLKVLEEPALGVHFFVITPSGDALLPTLRSRFFLIPRDTRPEQHTVLLTKGKEFLRLSKPERLKYIAELLTEYEDDEKHVYLKGEALKLLDGIELALRDAMQNSTSVPVTHYESLLRTKSYMRDRGASTKMLLEYIALVLM